MKILVTGSEGYLGSVLCPALEAQGYEVNRFDKELSNDVTNKVELKKASRNADLIIHLAGLVGLKICEENPELAEKVNVLGTTNACSCGKRVIFTSVHDHYDVTEVDEETLPTPKMIYAKSKIRAEKVVLKSTSITQPAPGIYHYIFGNVALRLGTFYGCSPKMRDDLLIHSFCREAVRTGKITLFQPNYMRAVTNINDAVRALIFFSARKDVGIYNVVSANISKGAIVNIVQKTTGCMVEYIDSEDEEGRNYSVSTEKIRRLGFGFNPQLEEAIKEITEYYRKLV